MSNLRMLTLVGLVAAALTPLYGCGSECAEGTTDQDGECVVAAKGCAEGTKLQDGECLLDTTGCGEGTMFAEGACIPAAETCSGDTTLDGATGTCVPNTDVICGAGTEAGEDGWCVPSTEACGDTAMFDEDSGRCVIAAAACSAGTELAANTNECLLVDEACADGLALDGETGACVSTEEVCDAGTKFDADSRLCLNDSCRMGDVLVDGSCMTPAEDLARDPDLTEAENNDPALGGTVETLMTPQAGDDPYVFMGAIGEPTDLDADGEVDQDVDVFEFEAEAGEWFEVSVQSLGLQAPAFMIEGPNDYLRYSPIGHAQHAVRTIKAPEAGAYTVTVLPSLVLQDDYADPMGASDWSYVGSLDTLDAPTATTVDMSTGSAQLSGDYPDLTDNLFELTGLQAGDGIRLDVSSSARNVEGLVQVWSDATTMASSTTVREGGTVEFGATTDSALVLIDFKSAQGAALDFEITASINGGQTTTTIPAGNSESLTVSAEVGTKIWAQQTNPTSAALEVTITGPLGTEIGSETELDSGVALTAAAEVAGDHTVTFTNTTGANVDATLIAKAIPPFDFGELPVGVVRSTPAFTLLEDDTQTFEFGFSVDAGDVLRLGQNNDDDDALNIEIHDSTGAILVDESGFYTTDRSEGLSDPREFEYFHAQAGGSYTLKVVADSYDDNINTVITIENLGDVMTDAGDLASGGSVTFSEDTPLARNELRFYQVNATEAGMLLMEAITPNREDIDVYIFEGDFEDYPSSSETPIDEQYNYDVDADNHYIILHAWAPLPSFTFDVALNATTPAAPDFTSTPALHIPDEDMSGVSDTLTTSGCTAVDSVEVYVDVTHDYLSDLHLMLTSPNGTTVILRDGAYSSADDVKGWFPQEFEIEGNLHSFENEIGNGDWTVTALDDNSSSYGNDTGGTLNAWGLTLTCK